MSENLKQVDRAASVLKIFRDRGEDMSEARHVIHYFYGGNFTALGKSLEELGYSVRPTVNDDGVVAERQEAIGEGWRTPLSCTCVSSLTLTVWNTTAGKPQWSVKRSRDRNLPDGWRKFSGRRASA